MSTRDELKRAYKESRPQMGVLLIRNTRTGRFDVRSSVNLRGAMNRLNVEVTPSTNSEPVRKSSRTWPETRSCDDRKSASASRQAGSRWCPSWTQSP